MAVERPDPPESFLSRWSRRKLAATRDTPSGAARADPASDVAAHASSQAAATAATPAAPSGSTAAGPDAALPPVESLTFESDFTPFLAPGVEPQVQRAALRKLLRDPRFNAMDGLDVYIDDYTKPSPLDPAVARTLQHAKALFAPTRTRVNEQGFVEDVPDEPVVAQEPATAAPPPLADAHAPPAAGAEPLNVAAADKTETR
jgi:hypothetical protein